MCLQSSEAATRLGTRKSPIDGSGVLLEDLVAMAVRIVMDGVGDVMAIIAVSAVVVVLDTRIINRITKVRISSP
eukprot:676022-Pleurochrysis_carterae.AAC.1